MAVHYSTDKTQQIRDREPGCVVQHTYHTETNFPALIGLQKQARPPSLSQAEEIALQT